MMDKDEITTKRVGVWVYPDEYAEVRSILALERTTFARFVRKAMYEKIIRARADAKR